MQERAPNNSPVATGMTQKRERERTGVPRHQVLNLDAIDDPTDGDQDGSAYAKGFSIRPTLVDRSP